MGRPAKDGWNDTRSHIEENIAGGRLVVSGSLWVSDIEYAFRISEQKGDAPYRMRGIVNLISPCDGRILQLTGPEKRRKMNEADEETREKMRRGVRLECLNATKSISMSSTKCEDIKAAVEKSARELFLKSVSTLEETVCKAAGSHETSFALVVTMLEDSFISQNCGKASKKTQKKHRRTLKDASEVLVRTPISGITKAAVRRVEKALGREAKAKLSLLSRFWQFCKSKGFCGGDDPFAMYLEGKSSPKKSAASLQKKALAYNALPEDVAAKLDEIIAAKAEVDGRYMGVVLAKEAGLSSTLACKLTWNDVIFMDEPGYVRIGRTRDELSGATHDFTRPVIPWGGEMLAARFAFLQNMYSLEMLRDMPVVSTAKNPQRALHAKDLTALCKSALREAGMVPSSLEAEKNQEHGAGITILLREYRHRLTDVCKISSDAAALRFLQGLTLRGDVTADHYRSFTSPDGQWHLYMLLRRDTRFAPSETRPAFHSSMPAEAEEAEPSGFKYVFASKQPEKLMEVGCTIYLKAGEKLSISSAGGFEGSIEVATKNS